MTTFGWGGCAIVFLAGVIGLGVVPAEAQEDAAGVIQYRQNVMKSQEAHFGAIGEIVKGRLPYQKHVAAHAAALNGTSKMIPQIFPEGSGTGETRAKPEIWQQWSKFEQAAKALEAESAKLLEIARGGDTKQITAQFLAVGEACKGCHKPFRARK
jgi:cytochrome c556